MKRRTSESDVLRTTFRLNNLTNLHPKIHCRSSLTCLKEKDYDGLQYNGVTNIHASYPLINVRTRPSCIGYLKSEAADFYAKATNYLSNCSHCNVDLELSPMAEHANADWPLKLTHCSVCEGCSKEQQRKARPLTVDAPTKKLYYSAYKQYTAMDNSLSTMNHGYGCGAPSQTSSPSFQSRNGAGHIQEGCVHPNTFMGIMNNLASTAIRVVYHIFLIIAQVVPVFEVVPCIYDFVVKGVSEIRHTENHKEVLTKTALLILQVLVILVSFIFVLCAVLIPVFTLCTVVLRRLFFFV